MLAIKLHKRRRPDLGRGTFVIPVILWQESRRFVKAWRWMLDYHNRGNPNDRIRYVTLVQVPDDTPVYLAGCWHEKLMRKGSLQRLRDIPAETKERVLRSECLPEMILGAPLDSSVIKWTKDIRLLYGRIGGASGGRTCQPS